MPLTSDGNVSGILMWQTKLKKKELVSADSTEDERHG